MRTFILLGTMLAIGLLMFTLSAGAQEGMRLYGNVYNSGGGLVTQSEVYIAIIIDSNGNGEYEAVEVYDTNNTWSRPSAVMWYSSNSTYELQLEEGDFGWNPGDDYVVRINGTGWLDGFAWTHEFFSIVNHWAIPEHPETENYVDVQTRYFGFKINEFLFNDVDTDDDEWVEIYNSENVAKSIDNWYIHDNDTVEMKFQFGDLPDVPAYNFIVVHFKAGTNETAFGQSQTNAIHIYSGSTSPEWSNDEDQVMLYDNWHSLGNASIIDFVAYDTDGIYTTGDDDRDAVQAGIWGDDERIDGTTMQEGNSLGRETDGEDTDTTDDWIVYITPSAGATNADGTPVPEFTLIIILSLVVLLFVAGRRFRPERS